MISCRLLKEKVQQQFNIVATESDVSTRLVVNLLRFFADKDIGGTCTIWVFV